MVINTNQALIALERDELEGKKEFTYANVIKCLRLRRENIWITNIKIPDKYQFLYQGKVSADAPETKRCSGRHPKSSEMAAGRFPRALHTRWYLPRTWSVWEEPSCLAEGEENKAEVHLGEICDLILICFFLLICFKGQPVDWEPKEQNYFQSTKLLRCWRYQSACEGFATHLFK